MTTTTEARIAIQHVEDIARLADQAVRNGVRILVTRDGAHFATSDVDPTRLHRLTPDGCDCNRFRWFGRCPHHALLLAELGLIEDAGDQHIIAMVADATYSDIARAIHVHPTIAEGVNTAAGGIHREIGL